MFIYGVQIISLGIFDEKLQHYSKLKQLLTHSAVYSMVYNIVKCDQPQIVND